MTNIIVRGIVSSNISWWKHAEQKELNQPQIGSVRIKICSANLNKSWYTCNYSKNTEYTQVIPSLEINYLLKDYNYTLLNPLQKYQKVELIIDSSSLYENEYCTEIKGMYKYLFIKCQGNLSSIPLINVLSSLSINSNKPKQVISSEELVNLLVPKEDTEIKLLETIKDLSIV